MNVFALTRDFDRVFDDVLGNFAWRPRLSTASDFAFAPRLNVTETADRWTVTAELPGVLQEDVDLSLEGEELTIKGEKKAAPLGDGEKNLHLERSFGGFARTLTLPGDINREQVAATFAHGVLTISLPKAQDAKNGVKKISINS
jgi:HSP20 family protein